MTQQSIPEIIKEVGFDFDWTEPKVWALDVPVDSMQISELEWHFDIPFWCTEGGYYDLKPRDVIEHKEEFTKDYLRTLGAELIYPLDIMFWKERWVLLDGLHRLVKAYILDLKFVKVRKIPVEYIKDIS